MLSADHSALVIIDVQGKLATLMHDRDQLYHSLRVLIGGARVLALPVLWLEQYPEGLGPTIPEVADLLVDQKPLAKLCFSACGQDEFVQQLEDSTRRQVLVAGIETHICVYQTVRDLLDRDYHVEVVADAVSSRTPQNRQLGLDRMARAGAHITSVETVLFELLREAGSRQFKEIVRLVK